jgi:peptidoglycan/LPS O-acetylase OafA/YrhL
MKPQENLVRPGANRLYEIDLLRFLAALMVVMLHYSFSQGRADFGFGPALGAVTQYGYLGVELFFMISGMVVLMSMWGRTTRVFVASRVSRLYPAFWTAVTLTTLVSVVAPVSGESVTVARYLANLTMFPQLANIEYTDGVYWTLWCEWRFYLILFGLSLVGITIRRTHWLLWGWLVVSVALQSLPIPGSLHDALALIIQPQFSHYFIAGMALYLVHRFGMTTNLALLLVVSYGNAVREAGGRVAERVAEGQSPNLFVATMVLCAIFAVMILAATGGLRWIRWRWLATLGGMTYPLYLIHAAAGVAIFNSLVPTLSPWLALSLVVVAMCGLAWLISVAIEDRLRPLLNGWLLRILRAPRRRGGLGVSKECAGSDNRDALDTSQATRTVTSRHDQHS